MKALQMSMESQAKHAVNNPVRDMSILKGGVGGRTLTEVQIRKLLEQQRAEKRARKEQKSWEKFLGVGYASYKSNKRKSRKTSGPKKGKKNNPKS